MYGTIARVRLKPGMENAAMQAIREEDDAHIPGLIKQYIYRMDADPNTYYIAVIFENKETYFANANSPEQHARYLKMRALMEAEPEWHDGEIIYPLE